jgi:catechol 2,3-dioxygenase-like lactoylglutathione lyase family enzyme
VYDIAISSPMERGVAESYDRLDELLLSRSDQLEVERKRRRIMNWTLEVVVVPVSDVDRAKAFYAEKLDFNVDHDTKISDENRLVQLTPPGSGCSIVVGKGVVPDMPPGSLKGLQLVVNDIHAARAQLVERGVEVSEVQVLGENPHPEADPLDNVGFVFFSDPDGNTWGVQQISARG